MNNEFANLFLPVRLRAAHRDPASETVLRYWPRKRLSSLRPVAILPEAHWYLSCAPHRQFVPEPKIYALTQLSSACALRVPSPLWMSAFSLLSPLPLLLYPARSLPNLVATFQSLFSYLSTSPRLSPSSFLTSPIHAASSSARSLDSRSLFRCDINETAAARLVFQPMIER